MNMAKTRENDRDLDKNEDILFEVTRKVLYKNFRYNYLKIKYSILIK